jgi:hypothetical protein
MRRKGWESLRFLVVSLNKNENLTGLWEIGSYFLSKPLHNKTKQIASQ